MPGFLKFVLFGVPILGLIVFLHELGHYIAARMVGVRVTQFSIGFGRRLTGFTRGGTDYRISLLPLGGYVKMAGDNIEEEREGSPDEFLSRKWYERAFIAVAGPAANFVTAIVCSILMFATGLQSPQLPNLVGPVGDGSAIEALGFVQGETLDAVDGTPTPYWHVVRSTLDEARTASRPAVVTLGGSAGSRTLEVPNESIATVIDSLRPDLTAEVGRVFVGQPAYSSGLREGDVIVDVGGVEIRAWSDLLRTISTYPGKPVEIAVRRNGERITRTLTPVDQDGVGKIGIGPVETAYRVEQFGFGESVRLGVTHTLLLTGGYVESLGKLLGKAFSAPKAVGSNLSGPLSIIQIAAEEVQRGRTAILNIIGFLSIALMVMNLLPIPVLDGGHILISLIEGVMRQPLKPKFMMAIWRAGMIFLLALMTFVIAQEGVRIWQRNRADRSDAPVEAPQHETPRSDEAG